MPNPFRPTLGSTPPLLVGRDEIIETFREGLESGPGHPSRAMLISGARGSGKTVMLNVLEKAATEASWRTIRLTTRRGMLRELIDSEMPKLLRDNHLEEHADREVSSVGGSVAGTGFTIAKHPSKQPPETPNFRIQLEQAAQGLGAKGGGLLIAVDEVHKSATADLRPIAQDVQLAFGKDLPVAFIAAGLPESVSDLFNDDVLTFLRRAERYDLGAVALEDVKQALAVPIQNSHEKLITPAALELAAHGTQGYPFLIQSVGFDMWRASGTSPRITEDHAIAGIERAMRRVGQALHEPSLAHLSAQDKSYLAAMAIDNGPSRTGEVAARLGVATNYASTYRTRLLEAGLITATSHGHVDFTLPYLRNYLREHVAVQALSEREPITRDHLKGELTQAQNDLASERSSAQPPRQELPPPAPQR